MNSRHYLVQYGHAAHVGRFTAADVSVARGDRVVVRTPRGLELGDILCEAPDGFGESLDRVAGGELLRPASPTDQEEADAGTELASQLFTAATDAIATADLPLSVIDVELLLGGSGAILHALPWAPCDADPLLAELSERFNIPVRLLDLATTPVAVDPPEKVPTCGKPDCGSGGGCSSCGTGGGCSTGSCSRGSVKSADDLTAYFADLRTKMEEQSARTPLH